MTVKKRRGFAILIILAVIATTSVVLATQLAAVDNQSTMAVRAAEELKARDVAEGCLDAADAYVEDYGRADTRRDFDELLDNDDSVTTTTDNFLPPAGLLPSNLGTASIPPGVNDQFHQYRVFRVAGVGACFVRFDDNSDDSSTMVALEQFTDAGEGTGVDLPQRDRDRSMVVTVVGVVPDRTVVADLYPKAHAVASITVLRAMPPVDLESAISAGSTANLDGSICGAKGGVVADSITGGACVCGALDAQLVSGSQPPPDCPGCTDCAAGAGSTVTAGARPNPNVEVPPFTGFLSNESFGLPESSGNNIGATGVCKLFFRDDDTPTPGFPGGAGSGDSQVFLWDPFDNNAQATLTAKFGGTAVGVPADNCTNVTSDPIPAPCNWPMAGGVPNGVTCAAGQSGCWKLIAHLRDGADAADFDPGAGPAIPEMANGDDFRARTAIPNVADTARTWADYCGGCTGCGAPSTTVTGVNAPEAYEVDEITSANFPSPAIVAFETNAADAATNTTLFGAGRPDVAMDLGVLASARLTILANGGVEITANSKLCCPTCNCATLGAVSGAACGPETANVIALDADGFAIRAEGNCDFGGKAQGIVGRIDCQTIFSDNGDCFIGDMVSHEPAPGPFDCEIGPDAAYAFCTTSSGICFNNSASVRGDLYAHSNICTKNNLSLSGTIQSESSIGWKNNGAIIGQIIAEGAVGAKNNNEITFDGLGGSAAQGIAAQLWIDGMW
ncbi:MAG: hypothetical protein A2138_21495 [Deltaproteobacteria bacterium RBG_16_71_12]|nr:MAG: hypothetical protein A2138_21495 [Deltaproteobacteria bacterium RBG_16_71_12]